MKMVSQLTRQAMDRHRVVSANAPSPLFTPSAQASADFCSRAAAIPPTIPVADIFPALPVDESTFAAVLPQPSGLRPISAPSAPQRPRTIYQQLMKNHDRMTERHLRT